MDEGNGPLADYAHMNDYWGIGGVFITSRWDVDERVTRWLIGCKKFDRQPLRPGHEEQLEMMERLWPHTRAVVVWFNSKTDDPSRIWRPGWGGPRPCSKAMLDALLEKYATPKRRDKS
jgi:hypothetical protein